MKRVLFVLLLAVALCNPVFSISVDEQLEQHRRWCKAHIPNPEGLSDKQLLDAVATVYMQELNDKEACDLFNAAGKFDSVFSLYSELLSSKSTDIGNYLEYKSRIRLFELADSLYSDDKCLYTRCGLVAFNAYTSNEQYDEALSLLDNLIERIQNSKLKTREGGLLCLCRSQRIYTLISNNREYPEIWEEAIQIEKDSWTVSKCSRIDDWCKSEIHLNLAYAFALNPIYLSYKNEAFSSICSTVNTYGSHLDYIKPFVYDHLSEVDQRYLALYGSCHPVSHYNNLSKGLIYPLLGDVDSTKALLAVCSQSGKYLELYYSRESRNYFDSKIGLLLVNQICQKSRGLTFYIIGC